MSEWQPIETAPPAKEVLVSDGENETVAWFCRGCMGWHPKGIAPTKWQELESSPNCDGERE